MAGSGPADDPRTRQARAVDAAVAVARRHGLGPERPVVLWDSNSTVVHLAPAPVVAKVANPARSDAVDAMAHELAVGLHLAGLGAPVAEPWPEMPAELYRQDGLALTFWRHYAHERDSAVPCRLSAPALRAVHRGLESYRGRLADFRPAAVEAAASLDAAGSAPRLKDRDRAFLRAEADRLEAELAGVSLEMQPIHGAAHRYNLLDLGGRVLWVDLETACRGPLEWDVVHLGCSEPFPEADPRLLDLLGDLTSLKVAIACWLRLDVAPDLAWHAAHHLGRLRARALRRAARP